VCSLSRRPRAATASRTSPKSRGLPITEPRARRAGFWIRAAAAAIDSAAGFLLAIPLSTTVGIFFARRAVVTLHIGDPHTLWKGPLPFLLGMVGEVVYLLPFTLLLFWLLDPVAGATLGKRLLRLRVRAAAGERASPSRLWGRSAIRAAGFWGWTLALLAGVWQLAVLATVAGAVVLAGAFVALGPRSLALHDRWTGTSVVRSPASPEA